MDKIEKLKKWIDESKRIVFFGGAGVSTESGIPDFRIPSQRMVSMLFARAIDLACCFNNVIKRPEFSAPGVSCA